MKQQNNAFFDHPQMTVYDLEMAFRPKTMAPSDPPRKMLKKWSTLEVVAVLTLKLIKKNLIFTCFNCDEQSLKCLFCIFGTPYIRFRKTMITTESSGTNASKKVKHLIL